MKNKINSLSGVPDLPPQKVLFLPDGTEIRFCEDAVPRVGIAKLYCSELGKFFSLSSRGLNEVHYYQTKNFHSKPNVHSNYPRMCNFIGAPYCHILVAKAWIGPRPTVSDRDGNAIRCELDHKDGNIRNCAASNLEYVTPDENRRRASKRRRSL